MRAQILGLCVVWSLGACVSSAKHEQLNKKYDFARAQLDANRVQIKTLQEEVDRRDQQISALASQLEQSRTQLAQLEAQQAENAQLIASKSSEAQRLSGELAELLKDRSRLKESTERLSQALLQLSARKAEAEQRVAEYRGLLDRFRNLIDAGTLRVRIIDGRMVLALPTDVLFDSGSAKLSKVGREAVQQVGSVLVGMPARRFQVEGHTDNVPIHNAPFPSNWELAAARALTVIRALTSSGVSSEALSAASYGEFHPVASNDTPRGRAENRRIEIVLLPDLSSLPGFEELQGPVATR